MAIEKKVSKSGVRWRAAWRNPYTKKVEKGPTRLTREEALCDEAEVRRRKVKDPESFIPERRGVYGRDNLTFSALAEKFLARTDLADTTVRSAFSALRPVVQMLGSKLGTEITRQDLRKLEASLQDAGLAQPTVHNKVKFVPLILSWARDRGLIEDHKVHGHRVKRGAHQKELPPSPSEIRAILEQSPEFLRRAILLSYCLGLRFGPSEALSARWEHFNPTERTLSVFSRKNKTRPWRRVPISNGALYSAMLEWFEQDGRCGYIVHRDGVPVLKNFQRHWHKAVQAAGIQRRITPYDCRHAFATEALAGGADPKATAMTMGHQDTTMLHKCYQHVLGRQERAVTASIPDVLGEQNWGTKDGESADFGNTATAHRQ